MNEGAKRINAYKEIMYRRSKDSKFRYTPEGDFGVLGTEITSSKIHFIFIDKGCVIYDVCQEDDKPIQIYRMGSVEEVK